MEEITGREALEVKKQKLCVGDVPDDCLAFAFRHLHSQPDREAVSLTCRRWRALEALSRHSLRFLHSPSSPPDSLHDRFMYALRTFPHVRSIALVRYPHLPDSFFQLFHNRYFTQLTGVHLRVCLDITDKSVDYFITGCPALTRLTLTVCVISDSSLHAIARGIPGLEYLDISCCEKVTDVGIDDVLKSCPSMQDISFSYCIEVDGWGLRNGKNLKKVQAEACRLTDAGLAEGLQGATSIQIFSMAGLRCSRGLRQLGASSNMIQVLCLRRCRVLDDVTVNKIAQGCINLRVWDLSLSQKVSLKGWQAVALYCVTLQFLDVRWCGQFCDRSMLAIEESCPSLCCIHVTSSSVLLPKSCRRFQISRPNVRVDTRGALTNCCHSS